MTWWAGVGVARVGGGGGGGGQSWAREMVSDHDQGDSSLEKQLILTPHPETQASQNH